MRLILLLMLSLGLFLNAEIPVGYYDAASDLTGTDLKNALHDIIDNNTNTNYDATSTGARGQMYAYFDNHSNTITCVYTGYPVSHTYGTFTAPEGINCEHTFCQSWFQGIPEQAIAKADVHHLFPVEEGVNSSRSNYPLDNVNTITHTYHEAGNYYSYLGTNTEGATVFEPDDEHKGDAARALLYFSVRYQMDLTQGDVDMLATLIQWHTDDPISTEEINRNDDIYDYQHNRNPFVDVPDYVDDIWGATPTDLTPPIIQNIIVQSTTEIYIHFSESVDATTSETTSNYSIDNGIGNPANAVRGVSSNNSIVALTLPSLSRGITYNLTVNNVKDLHNNTIEVGYQRNFQVLAAGDIVLLGVNTTDPDDFTILTTVDILNGTHVTFTDNGWLSSGLFRVGEGAMEYFVPDDMPAGTLVNYSENEDSGDFINKDINFQFSTSGDQLLIFQGDSDTPLFVYGLNIEGNAVWQADATSSNTSALPTGLINGTTACAVNEADNVKYNGSTSFSSRAECLSTVSNASNWSGSATRYDLTTFSDFTLPVTLTDFSVEFNKNQPVLFWTTESEEDNLGWNIFRSENANGWSENNFICININLSPGMGNSTEPVHYTFSDEYSVQEGHEYWYWLQSISTAQELELFGPVNLEIPLQGEITPLPGMTNLFQNFPNPFNPQTTISFNIAEGETGTFTIYNIKGQMVFSEEYETGVYSLEWKAEGLSSGLYFYKLSSPTLNLTRKMILLK